MKISKTIHKRHTCIICGRKKYEYKMENVFNNSWVCTSRNFDFSSYLCCEHPDILIAKKILNDFKKLKKIRVRHLFNK